MARTPLFRTLNKILSVSVRNEPFWSKVKVSRRESFQIGGLTGMAAYLSACRGTETEEAEFSGLHPSSKVVVVGGGAAGLSAAYYLKKAGVRSQVYEANERLGGRIYTQYEFNKEAMFCERGGELIDSGHKQIQDLMKELGLELQKLPDDTLLNEVHYLEKKWRSEDELIESFRPLAKRIAKDAENFVVKDEFVMPTFENPISDRVKILDNTSLQAYLDAANEAPKWVRELIRIAYVGEYGLEADEQSAINLVSFIGSDLKDGFKMFGESDELYRIQGGNTRLVQRLSEELEGQITRSHRLKAIGEGREGRLQLLFENTKRKGPAQVVEVSADTVILTLPFTVLRHIQGLDKIGIRPRKLQAIRELGYGTNSKLMIGFRERYWRNAGGSFPASDGGVVTDLDLQGGWDSSRKQAGESGIFTNFMGGKRGETFSAAQLKATFRDLDTLFPGIGSKHDGNLGIQVWPAVETARGSYICQKPGQYTSLGGVLASPECRGRLLFAGEHTSDVSAGFMNGAVDSGLRVATEYLSTRTAAQPEAKKA